MGLCLVVQDLRQLWSLYGEDATIILNNCASKLYLPGLGLETTERLEREFGTRTMTAKEDGCGDQSRERSLGRRLMHASEIRTLKDDEALFVYANKA
ncbi:MAG TPA: hypothetical protein DCP28_35875, partial [Cytophagales bacterium]|nr:hypothetical protein [Cytophagales bacterium]